MSGAVGERGGAGMPHTENSQRSPRTYFLYIDEAGNFDFSPKGSKYLIMTCAVMQRPFNHIDSLASIKYDLLERGLGEKFGKRRAHEFHAAEDWQSVRDDVFAVVSEIAGLSVYSVIIRKNMANPAIRPPEKIYAKAFSWLIRDVRDGEQIMPGDLAVTVTDVINFKGKNDALLASLKGSMRAMFMDRGIRCRLYQHQSCSDFNLQVVDYCSWAIQRKWEKEDARSFGFIKDAVRREGDIFRNGDCVYYTFGKK